MARRQRTQRRTTVAPRTIVILIALLMLVYLYQIGQFDQLLERFGLPRAVPRPQPAPAQVVPSGAAIQTFFTTPSLVYPDIPAQRGPSPLLQAVVADIAAARTSIALASFDFDLVPLTDALLQAHQRGVNVQVIVDSENLRDADVAEQTGRLQQAGVGVVFQRTGPFMHNKFIVVDANIAWTGSWNMTTNGTYRNNNNMVRLVSAEVSEDYRAEFAQMFAGRFGSNKAEVAPYPVAQVGGATVEVYFSPQDGVIDHVLERVGAAQRSIRFLTFSFTSDPLTELMLEKAAAGVQVRGVFETQNTAATGADFSALRRGGVGVLQDGNCYIMHHKVIIIDEHTVITGSYNFTNSAERSNDENLIIIDDPEVALRFEEEFSTLYTQAQSPLRCK